MKINPLTQAAGFLRLVQSKGDGQAGRDSRENQQNQRDKSDQEKRQLSSDEMAEKVGKAIVAFGADPQTQTARLAAEVEGKGPGLRVVLKDAEGVVVRQFTGEEFLRLREVSSKDNRSRGRLLDQKF